MLPCPVLLPAQAKKGAEESDDEDDLADRADDPFVRQAMLEEFGVSGVEKEVGSRRAKGVRRAEKN